jgi:PKD domain
MPRMSSFLRTAWGPPIGAVLVALAICLPAAAGPPDGVEVNIVKPDGTKVAPFIATQADDDLLGTVDIRQPNGTTIKVDVGGGVSIYSLLDEAGAATGYREVELLRPNGGGTITLTRRQIESPRPPGIFKDDTTGAIMFVGAPATAGARYVDARDYFELDGAAIELTQVEQEEVDVEVEASRTKIDPGESVEFTAQVDPNGDYRYDWAFEPGVASEDAGRKVSHRFEKAGSYKVVVGVYSGADDENSIGSGNVRVQVGDPKQSDEDREGGGDNGAAAAPDSGAVTGSDGAAPYTPYTPPPATSTPVPPTPPTPTPPPPKPSKPPAIATSGTTVEGNLLADVGDPPPSSILESAARAARDGNPKDDDGPDGAGVPEAALSIAGVLALLGLGAGIETRQGRMPRLRRPRLALPRRGA